MKIYILSASLACVLSIILGYFSIPLLKRLKVGQPVLKYVTKHYSKSGTPTMGGLFFVLSAVVIFIFFSSFNNRLSIITISITVGFALVGFMDDFLKIKFKNNQGLTAKQKLIFELIVSVFASYIAYDSGLDFVFIPFTKKELHLGVISVLFNAFIFIATVNSVNLTDGLDGLCSSVSIVYFLGLGVLILLQISTHTNVYLINEEYKNLSIFSFCMAGALLGYLVFNSPKASVFMGDTGSLSIGGAISTISVFSGNSLYIPIGGICFLISSLSVIIQVVYFKKTKRRVFIMAPLHHHFQEKGYLESKITYAYFIITALVFAVLLINYL